MVLVLLAHNANKEAQNEVSHFGFDILFLLSSHFELYLF